MRLQGRGLLCQETKNLFVVPDGEGRDERTRERERRGKKEEVKDGVPRGARVGKRMSQGEGTDKDFRSVTHTL